MANARWGSTVTVICIAGLLAQGSLAQKSEDPIRPIGEFSNVRVTGEHAYGYALQLWRAGDSVIGLFLASEGPDDSPATGILTNVKFNSRTGSLSFTAKLSIGVSLLPGGGQEPSHDLFEFSGTMKSATVTGSLRQSDPREPSRPGSQELISLGIQHGDGMLPALSYGEWKLQSDKLLKVRGPKW
jgi:hypothetical protein